MLNFIIFSKIYLSVNWVSVNWRVGELACRSIVLSVKCLVGEPAVSELGVGELSFGEPTRTRIAL
jgi:hypothetical protein